MINIISHRNGSGLEQDFEILKSNLNQEVRFVEWQDTPQPADINIFLELVNPDHLTSAKLNYLIPNQEWYDKSWEPYIPDFDLILCKTRYAQQRFKIHGGKTEYISFTSPDKYSPNVKKDFSKICHLAGKSKTKGTDQIIKCWQSNHSVLPSLYMSYFRGMHPRVSGIEVNRQKLPSDQFTYVQNMYGIHLCPSKSEGFGHYINEAMSCGSVVITTDAPPMNELVTRDRGCLIQPFTSKLNRIGQDYFVNSTTLTIAIREAINSTDLKQKGEAAREWYLNNDQFFKHRLKEIFE